ncbi:Hypothetical predicted protein [Paramuricea clavata]|uniref:Uncharacterized protein n=1 Tax=Paramuricea clavata TaxID=317549 RepID=A0A7D9E8T1_PARCT|nr:Hypothetical predicted protein [Paramuricea clavata]
MFWLSALLLSCVKRVDILPFFRSDHSIVYLELCLPSGTHRGHGVWKLNTRHLSDESFVKLVSDFWSSWRVYKSSFLSLTAWWDAGNARLKQYIREFSKKKAVSRRKLITSLEHTLFHLNRRLLDGDEVLPIIEDVKSELEAAHRDQARGARIRANVQWAEEGEASTKYFFGLERIARAWVAFYGLLFTSQSLDRIEQDFFLNSLSMQLSSAEQSLCEGGLTEGECKRALDAMATAITNRLLGVIAKVTHSDQTCGVPGRNSLESVRLLKDVVFHANQNRKAAAIISLDQEKAFDRVEWGYFIPCIEDYEFWSILPEMDLALNALFHLFTRYEKASGAKLNVKICHGLLIGTWQSRSNLPIALDWSNVEIIVLGSRISNDNEEQWVSKIKALKTTLSAWNRRALSFRGRALIANMLGLSTLWYICSVSVIPEEIIKAVNGEVFPFVWRKKREWLARSPVTQRPNHGGLGVVDVHRKMLSLHVLWVKRLIFRPNMPWTSFFSQYLKRAFPGRSVHQILILAVLPKYAMDALPPFYRSVMTAWFALERKFVDNEYVICGPRKSVVTLEQLSASFVYDTLSHQHRKQHRCVKKYANWGLPVDWSKFGCPFFSGVS